MHKSVAGVLIVATVLLLTEVAAGAAKDEMVKKVRALAENILGSNTVKSLQLTEAGATVLIRWESATYRPQNKLETTRELLYGEAELATGSIMGKLTEISRVRFVILRKDQTAATGENLRGKGVTMIFASAFGGGTFTPKPPKEGQTQKGGTSAAKD